MGRALNSEYPTSLESVLVLNSFLNWEHKAAQASSPAKLFYVLES